MTDEELRQLDDEGLRTLQRSGNAEAVKRYYELQNPQPITATPEADNVEDPNTFGPGDIIPNAIETAVDLLGLPGSEDIQESFQNPEGLVEEAAVNTQPPEQERGIISELGEKVVNAQEQIMNLPKMLVDGIDAIVPDDSAYQELINPLVDAQMTADERQQAYEDKIKSGEADNLTKAMYGTEKGLVASTPLTIPFSVAGALLNQNTDAWTDPPEVLKGSAWGENMFEISQLLLPSIMTGGIAGAGRGGFAALMGGLGAESVMEAAVQNEADEVAMSRYLALRIGNLIEPYYGEEKAAELTTQLLNGSTTSRLYLGALATAQIAGFTFGPAKLREAFGAPNPPHYFKAAKALGKNVDEVAKKIDDTTTPNYSPDKEPVNSMGEELDANLPKSQSDKYIQLEAFTADQMRRPEGPPVEVVTLNGRRIQLEADSLPMNNSQFDDVTQPYYTNNRAVTGEDKVGKMQEGLDEIVRSMPRLRMSKDMLMYNQQQALNFLLENFESDMVPRVSWRQALREFAFSDMVLDTPKALWTRVNKNGQKLGYDKMKQLLHYKEVDEPGMMVALQILRKIMGETQMLAKQIDQANQVGQRVDDGLLRNFEELITNGGLVAAPIRKSKSRWWQMGMAQQLDTFDNVNQRFNEYQAAVLAGDAPRQELKLNVSDLMQYGGLKKLIKKAKTDPDSKAVFDAIVAQLAIAPPDSLLKEIELLDDVLKSEMASMRGETFNRLFFAGMLSRLGTQAAAFANTSMRLIVSPVAGMIRAIPPSLSGSKEGQRKFFYNYGQLIGGWQGLGTSMDTFRRALVTNKPINPGTRFDMEKQVETLEQIRQRNQVTFENRIKELDRTNAHPSAKLAAVTTYHFQRLVNQAVVNYGPRFLMSSDEGFKVMRAHQIAYGNAFAENFDAGELFDAGDKAVTNLQKVFVGGAKTGKINPESDLGAFALDSAKLMTFQREVPDLGDELTGGFGRFFAGQKFAADNDPFWKYFNPWIRMGYDALAQTGGNFPVLGEVAQRTMNARTKAMIEAASAPNASAADRLRLYEFEANQSGAVLVTLMALMASVSGFTTGSMNLENGEQKDSFVVPNVFTDSDDKLYFDYSRLEPYSTYIRTISDLTRAVTKRAITQGEYGQAITDVIASMGVSMLDKNYFAGVINMTEIFSVKNWTGGNLPNIISSLLGGMSVAGLRGVGDLVSPQRKAINDAQVGSGLGNTLRGIDRSQTGNALTQGGELFNPITGEPDYKVAVPKGGNPHAGVILQELIGSRTANVSDVNHPAVKILNTVDWIYTPRKLRKIGKIELNPTQQGILSKDLTDPEIDFPGSVIYWWNEDGGKDLWEEFQDAKGKFGDSTDPNSKAFKLKDQLKREVENLWNDAKENALLYGRLSADENLQQQWQIEEDLKNKDFQSSVPDPEMKGLYQDLPKLAVQNDLPTEVQNLIDFA